MSTSAPVEARPAEATRIDPRGARFVAALTAVTLAAALVFSPSPATVALLAAQTVLFGVGAVRGVQHTPYAWLFRTVLRPRLGRPTELEDATPPRFAQAVGLGFGVLALICYVAGSALLGAVATGLALAAAFLNAAFGFCLGCEIYLLLHRARPARTPAR